MRWGLINVSPQCYNTTLQRKEAINDNTRPIVSGWRFIHHPKVKKDTRKIRLTLRQINQLRLQSEAHQLESQSELDFIRQMYGTPVGEEAAPAQ